MLGVCLLVIPSHAAGNNNQNTINAETYIQDGVTYETIYIQGDSNPEQSKTIFNGVSTGNYRYVLTGDWDMVTHKVGLGNGQRVTGKNIIFDLNGHNVKTVGASGGSYYPYFVCNTLEYTDTSLIGGSIETTVIDTSVQTVICSGNFTGKVGSGARSTKANVEIRGSKQVAINFWGDGGISGGANLSVAPYMRATSDDNTYRFYVPTHNTYAVSDYWQTPTSGTAHVSGLTVGQLTSKTFPEGYYLWGVTADGKYEYLEAQYLNAEWAQYDVIYLQGDSNHTQSLAFFKGTSTGNYHYILMDDWDLITNKAGRGAGHTVLGNHVILDLNGHVITCGNASNGSNYVYVNASSLELTDSSLAGTGVLGATTSGEQLKTVIISGNGMYNFQNNNSGNVMDITVRGGKYMRLSGDGILNSHLTVAPYLNLTYSEGIYRYYAASHDYYAVSDNTLIFGAYNYEFGQVWDLTVGQLANLAVPDDKTYYLWGCTVNGGYEYLAIEYRDGAWVKVAA